jgi:hypothetical protein
LFIWAVFENNRISRTFWATFSTVKIVHGFWQEDGLSDFSQTQLVTLFSNVTRSKKIATRPLLLKI